jgi:exonuclease VII large subunit
MKKLYDSILLLARSISELVQIKKTEFEWFKSHHELATKHDLIAMRERIIDMNAKQLADALDQMTTQTGKIAKEQSDRFDTLTKAIADLNAEIANGDVTPEVEAKQTALKAALDSLDAAIPDAPSA